MPGIGEARYALSSAALVAMLRGEFPDENLYREVVEFHRWLGTLPADADLMEVHTRSEGKSGFEVVFGSISLPSAYQIPRSLYDPKHQHQPEQQLEH